MTDRCQGLAWEHDGICIRPAASPLELIEEGNTLRHCVGGYAGTHAMGKSSCLCGTPGGQTAAGIP